MPSHEPIAERPWEALPVEVADALRPELPGLADDIIAAVRHGVPDYARDRRRALRAGAAGGGGGGPRPVRRDGRPARRRRAPPGARST
ncbi:MAG: hypothetical protein WKF40_04355 [Thermoleophilaceae bacterium]